MLTVSFMFPATGPAVHVAPPAAVHVHDADATCGRDRTGSVTVAPAASDGPAFETTIVYVVVPPARYVAAPPTGRSTVSLMFPEIGPAAQVAPPAATQVHEAEATCGSVAIASVTLAPMASDGPAFETTIVYVTEPPARYVATPSVFVIERSVTRAPGVSVSVALSGPGPGSEVPAGGTTVAVLTRFPVAPGLRPTRTV